jgi:hypothetical protein
MAENAIGAINPTPRQCRDFLYIRNPSGYLPDGLILENLFGHGAHKFGAPAVTAAGVNAIRAKPPAGAAVQLRAF